MSERLPTVGGTGVGPSGLDAPGVGPSGEGRSNASPATPGVAAGPPPPPNAPPPSSAARLILTLAFAGAIAGLAIVLVHRWSEPRIEAHRARVLATAIDQVLGTPASTGVYFLTDGGFDPAPTVDTTGLDRIYVGFDEGGGAIGIATVAAEPGFQDVIRLIFGYDPNTRTVVGMRVLESKETPGLGDKIEKDMEFVGAFDDVLAPILGVKPGAGSGAPNEVDMITGATISAQAVIDIINNRLAALEGPLDRLEPTGGRAP